MDRRAARNGRPRPMGWPPTRRVPSQSAGQALRSRPGPKLFRHQWLGHPRTYPRRGVRRHGRAQPVTPARARTHSGPWDGWGVRRSPFMVRVAGEAVGSSRDKDARGRMGRSRSGVPPAWWPVGRARLGRSVAAGTDDSSRSAASRVEESVGQPSKRRTSSAMPVGASVGMVNAFSATSSRVDGQDEVDAGSRHVNAPQTFPERRLRALGRLRAQFRSLCRCHRQRLTPRPASVRARPGQRQRSANASRTGADRPGPGPSEAIHHERPPSAPPRSAFPRVSPWLPRSTLWPPTPVRIPNGCPVGRARADGYSADPRGSVCGDRRAEGAAAGRGASMRLATGAAAGCSSPTPPTRPPTCRCRFTRRTQGSQKGNSR